MNITRRITAVAFLAITGIVISAAQDDGKAKGKGRFDVPGPPRLTVMSTSFNDNADLPLKHTCLSPQPAVSPELHWINVPAGTVSFVVMFHDMDPRNNKGNDDTMHWMMWNVPANISEIPEGFSQAPPGAIQGKTLNRNGYGGPCMPPGGRPHHYMLELYAMDNKLDLTAEASRADVYKAMEGHILDHCLQLAHWARPL